MTERKFNPIPLHAPEFRTNMAHYLDVKHASHAWGKDKDREKAKSRCYTFKIGSSDKIYKFQDKFMDNIAMELLEEQKANNRRLVLKGYISPNHGDTYFAVLTHFGIHVRSGMSHNIINPETGEKGFYKLITELRNVK